MDRVYFEAKLQEINRQLGEQRGLMMKAGREQNERDRQTYFGNVRYLEGQRDVIIRLIEARSGFHYS